MKLRTLEQVVFLPHYGEWGWFVPNYISLVHYFEAATKVVCCEAGQELFFPTADSFIYDWANPLADYEKKGWRDCDNPAKHQLIL